MNCTNCASETTQDTNWPPRSLGDVLTFSPSRYRREEIQRQRDISPSPVKQKQPSTLLESSKTSSIGDRNGELADDNVEDESEDEETLRLKLQAIEARLKLKKLAKSKRATQNAPSGTSVAIALSETCASTQPVAVQRTSAPYTEIQVPLSPKRTTTSILPDSPSRVQLGIDKGLRASDVSLDKARLQRPTALAATKSGHRPPLPSAARYTATSTTYSERMNALRDQDLKREQSAQRTRQSRSIGFSSLRNATHSVDKLPSNQAPATASCLLDSEDVQSRANKKLDRRENQTVSQSNGRRVTSKSCKRNTNDDDDQFMGFTLSKRHVQPNALTEALDNKALISLPRLLKEVHGPDYDPPELEKDYVVYGIIASKSSPFTHDDKHKSITNADPDATPKSKYMVLHLTDLQWELNLFLFDSGFETFWKLSVGTVVAILNPAIMPPRLHLRDTGAFSLKISSSEDTILELGTSKDIGFCKSIKKDGHMCNQWVDARKTEFCEFHISLRVEKTKAGRMEINGMAGLDLFGKKTKSQGRSGLRHGSPEPRRRIKKLTASQYNKPHYDRSTGETAYLVRGSTTAKLLDAEDYANGGLSAAERSRQRLAAHEKERCLAKELASRGTGIGSDYMRVNHPDADQGQTAYSIARSDALDEVTRSLVSTRAADVRLSPTRGGRPTRSRPSSGPVGWSGAYKRGLPSPERQTSLEDHVEKRSKLASVPSGRSKAGAYDPDDDDDLDIVQGSFEHGKPHCARSVS